MHYKGRNELAVTGPVVEPGPRRRPAEPQIVGSNPTRPANTNMKAQENNFMPRVLPNATRNPQESEKGPVQSSTIAPGFT